MHSLKPHLTKIPKTVPNLKYHLQNAKKAEEEIFSEAWPLKKKRLKFCTVDCDSIPIAAAFLQAGIHVWWYACCVWGNCDIKNI